MDISELDDMIASSNVGKSTATNTISGTHEVILNRSHAKKEHVIDAPLLDEPVLLIVDRL